MKRRSGLVSNSSSSSFTCDVCGETESGMDMGLDDFEMVRCTEGHIVCNYHLHEMTDEIAQEVVKKAIEGNKLDKDTKKEAEALLAKGHIDTAYVESLHPDELFGYDWRYNHPIQLCPICQLKSFTDWDLVKFLTHKLGTTKKEVEDEIRSRFKNLQEMHEALKV